MKKAALWWDGGIMPQALNEVKNYSGHVFILFTIIIPIMLKAF